MSYFEFPRSRTYDSDLGWLIDTVKEISDQFENFTSWEDEHKLEYEALLARVSALENTVNTAMSDIDARFSTLETQLTNDIDTKISQLANEITLVLASFSNTLIEFKNLITKNYDDTIAYVDEQNRIVIARVEDLIAAFIADIPDLTTVNVLNPVRGEVTSIQVAVDDLYEFSRYEALTAYEYDTLGLTASEYDALNLTATEYDLYGKKLLWKNPLLYMYNPITGDYQWIGDVVSYLSQYWHGNGLTATQYDALDLTASEYDALDLTAYEYDYNGIS